MVLLQECRDCEWSDEWEGGSAAEDPAIDHVEETGHTVRTTVKDSE